MRAVISSSAGARLMDDWATYLKGAREHMML